MTFVCIDPGRELGLVLGETYELVRVLDPWTVAVRSTTPPTESPEHILDTWQHLVPAEAPVVKGLS
jgi:hypothetical protein